MKTTGLLSACLKNIGTNHGREKMNPIEMFTSQAPIVQILDIAFIASLAYEIIIWNSLNISLWILGLIITVSLYLRYFKKEE